MDAITYAMSKKYTDSKVTESSGLHREIVNSLPSTGDNSTIYMVLDPNASSPDIYDEWLWVNGAYEHIGSTRVDLSDYYNKTQIDAALSSKANTSDIPTALSGLSDDSTHRLVTDTEKSTWNGKANTATSLSGYGITDAYTKTEVDTALSEKISSSEKGVSNGVAELDANGKIPSSQLPSYVDDTIEGYLYEGKWYSDSSHTHEVAGETEKIYVELSTNKTYRWSGSVFVEISESLALGETSSTAYRGDRGKEAYDHSQSDHSGVIPTFTEASTRANIATGESIATIFGKIKKFFTDLKTVAFSGSYNDLSDKPDLSGKADIATTLSGYGITDAYTKSEVDTALNKLDKYWKLDAGTVIPDNSNLNDYKTPGNYYHLKSNVSTISNIPDNKGFRLTVLLDLYDPEYVEQIFNPIGSYKTYKRYYNTYHTWTDWAVVEDDLSSKAGAFSIDTFLNTSSFSIPSHDTYGFNMDISKSGRTAIAIMGILGADGRKLTGLSIADFYISHPNPHSTESRILIDFYNGSNSTVSIRENGIEFTILYSEGLLGD